MRRTVLLNQLLACCFFMMLLAGCVSKPEVKRGGTFRASDQGMGIEGRVVCDGDLLENAYVYVYQKVDNGFRSRPFRVSKPTNSEGRYQLDLPRGRFYIVARKRLSGESAGPIKIGDYYGYYGGNPVAIREKGYLWVGVNTVVETPLDSSVKWKNIPLDDTAGLRGVVYYNETPVENAYVYLYLDEKTNFKGEAYQFARTDKHGQFYFYDLPESYYYVVVRRRQSGLAAGPVQVGDIYAFYGGNPIFAELDEFTTLRIDCISKAAEIGKESLSFEKTTTRIEGFITDSQGKPLAGVYAFVYLTRDMSHGRPPYLSMTTKADGRFTIHLPKGGIYFLGARKSYGDAPAPGELYGRYQGSMDHAIVIKTGQSLKDMNLTVQPILGQQK